jgi:actin, other eukaryote
MDSRWFCRRLCSKSSFSKFFYFKLIKKDVFSKVKNNLPSGIYGVSQKTHFIGDEAISKNLLSLGISYPIEKGVIQDFYQMENVWHHTFFHELLAVPEDYPVIMNEELGNTQEKREKITQIMFETFAVPAFFLEPSCLLSMNCSGRTSGAVLNMGDTKNDVICIHEGKILPKGEISYLAGRELTTFLLEKLTNAGHHFGNNEFEKFRLTQDIKEKMCYVRMSKDSYEKFYKLPDGNVIKLDKERFLTTELLFNKENDVGGELSLQEIVFNCIKSRDDQIQDELYKNIVLSGGASLFDGMSERLESELKSYHPKQVRVLAPPERKYSHWIGASILTSMSSFQSKWVSKDEYEEFGPDILKSKLLDLVEVDHQVRQPNKLSEKLTRMKDESKLTDLYIE